MWKNVWAMGLVFLMSTPLASAVELNYVWKPGAVNRFDYQDDSRLTMAMEGMPSMPGMPSIGINMRIQAKSIFSQKVLSVRPDGRAELELRVEQLEVFQDGVKVMTLDQLPPEARVARALVDRKGRMQFIKRVTVHFIQDRIVLVARTEAGPEGASASARASGGGTDVQVMASVNPKTGKVTARVEASARQPELEQLQVTDQDPGVELFPKELFTLLELPEGDMRPGQKVSVATPMQKMDVQFVSFDKNVAALQATVTQDVSQQKLAETGAGMEGASGGEATSGGDMPDVNAMMAGAMGSPGSSSGAGAAGGQAGEGSMDVKTQGQFNTRFDVGGGLLLDSAGKLTMDSAIQGMGRYRVDSSFNLKRVAPTAAPAGKAPAGAAPAGKTPAKSAGKKK